MLLTVWICLFLATVVFGLVASHPNNRSDAPGIICTGFVVLLFIATCAMFAAGAAKSKIEYAKVVNESLSTKD